MKSRFLAAVITAAMSIPPAAVAPSFAHAQNLPSLGDTEREELSPLIERKLGEQIMRDIRRDHDYLDDAPLLEYLNTFGNTLLAARPEARGEAGYDFFFFAVRDPMLNAFALPGGFVAVHSATILAAQNESELAAVMAHEIGHVAQRHIARMLGKQKQDALIPLAAAVLAVLAARTNSDAAQALVFGGGGLSAQRQLSFSRDAEREADRVGLQIMRDAGFDMSGMVAFFGRLQTASRAYNDTVPTFLRSHPLTTERIADIEARINESSGKQRADSLDFHLIRARVRVLQDDTPQGLLDTAAVFENQLEKPREGRQQKSRLQAAAADYGLALVAWKQRAYSKALTLLQAARAMADSVPEVSKTATYGAIFANLAIDIRLAANQSAEALKEAESARAQFPLARGIARQYAQALLAVHRYSDAVLYLREQTQLYRQEPQLQELLAQTYAAQGKQALQHIALAESYALSGSVPDAIDQLAIARNASDASFYDHAVIDVREREWQARMREEKKDRQKNPQ